MKSLKIFIGIDIGTSISKGVAMDTMGNVRASYSMRHSYDIYVQDYAQNWWNEVVCILHEIIKDEYAMQVYSITVSGMVPNIIMIDEKGELVSPTRLFYDDFAIKIEKELDKVDGTKWMNEYISKLIYLSRYEENWNKVSKVLTSHTYCVYMFTGKYVCDIGTAIECGNAFDLATGDWNRKLLSAYSINPSILPQIVAPTDIIGTISDELAKQLGINAHVQVIAGSHDSVATLIGAGVLKKEEALIYYGTYNCSAILEDDIINLLQGKTIINPIHWITSIPRNGQLLDKIVEFLCGKDNFGEFSELAKNSIPGANGVLFIQNPHLLSAGISSEPNGRLVGLTTFIEKGDCCRAVFESFGYGLLATWKYDGVRVPKKCYATGGGSKSDIWVQITSNITEVEQILLENAENAVGTALLGIFSYSQKLFEDIQKNRISRGKHIVADGVGMDKYLDRFEEYYHVLMSENRGDGKQ